MTILGIVYPAAAEVFVGETDHAVLIYNGVQQRSGARMKDDVVFLGEQPCPRPYDSERVPIYRVVRKDHPYFGHVLTEQQVLLSGLYFSGLAPRERTNFKGFPVITSKKA